MIFYLSPSDYHWIHSPVTCKVVDQWVLGTKSYPVNKYGLKYGKKPLSTNYRLMSEVWMNDVSMVIVKVGAMFINSIEMVEEGESGKKEMKSVIFHLVRRLYCSLRKGYLNHPFRLVFRVR